MSTTTTRTQRHRLPGVLPVEAAPAARLAELAELAGISEGTRLLATDLSLGAWRSNHAATELAEQLRLPEPGPPAPFSLGRSASYAQFIGWSIDREAEGRHTWQIAFHQAQAIAEALAGSPAAILVLAPRFGAELDPADAALIRAIVEAAALEPDLRCIVVGAERPIEGLELEWLAEPSRPPAASKGAHVAPLALVPGIVAREVAASLGSWEGAAESLGPGSDFLLVDPTLRADPATLSRLDFDALAQAQSIPEWLHAYAQAHGNNLFADPWFLWAEACVRLGEGGAGVAAKLADRAAECSIGTELEAPLAAFAQGIRIGSERFAEAAAAPDPPERMPSELRAFLLHAKGWGLVMEGDAQAAETYFSRAYELLSSAKDDLERLYLLNIWALGRFRLGDVEDARRLELEIAARHAAMERQDRRLQYVNSMNLARVERQRGAYAVAAAHYADAFETSRGLASPSDLIYESMCLGALHELQCETEAALACHLRAALYVASLEVPEALARRTVAGICKGLAPPDHARADALAAQLSETLLGSAAAAGLAVDAAWAAADAPTVLGADVVSAEELGRATAALGPGWSVIAAPGPAAAPLDTEAQRRLRRAIAAVVRQALADDAVDAAQTFCIDNNCGRGIAAAAGELLETALRLECERVLLPGEEIPLASRRGELELRLEPELAPGVEELARVDDEIVCVFKRYRPPTPLGVEDVRLLGALTDGAISVGELAGVLETPVPDVLRHLRSLEQRRIVALRLPAD